MAYIPSTGSTVAFQSNPSVLQATVGLNSTNASVITVNSPQSVSGTVGASVIGHAPVVIVGGSILTSATANQSVSGTVNVGNFPTTQNVSGSVAAWLQSTDASIITVGGATGNSSVMLLNGANVIGSVTALQGTPEWTVKSSLAGGIFPISGSVAVGNFPTNQNVSGSVVAFQGAGWSGSVATFQTGTWRTSVISSTPTSMLVGASIFGQLPGGTAVLGSVATLQGTNPWTVTTNGTSVMTVWGKSPSIVGTYAEDAAHTTADKGLFVLGVRNDTVASFTSANGEYNPFAHDSAGRVLNKPFAAEEARIEGYHSVVSGSVTTLVAAAGAGLRNYITDVWLANTGAATTLVTFRSGGGTSILGYTVVPAGGGSNLPGLQTPIRTLANETFDFQASTSTSVLYATVKGYKAP